MNKQELHFAVLSSPEETMDRNLVANSCEQLSIALKEIAEGVRSGKDHDAALVAISEVKATIEFIETAMSGPSKG
jgi:hypothetical protein